MDMMNWERLQNFMLGLGSELLRLSSHLKLLLTKAKNNPQKTIDHLFNFILIII